MKTHYNTFFRSIAAIVAVSATLSLCETADAAYPYGYYDSLNGKSGSDLVEAIKNLALNHTEISYGASTWEAFEETDVRVVNGMEYWWDMYSDELIPVSAGRPNSSVMNIEHSVPNSWWGKTKNAAYKDLAHLNPADATANSHKSNYPLAEVGSVSWTNGVSTVGTPASGQGGGSSNAYEPADEYKGDFARAYMYMFTVYNDISWGSNYDWMYDTSSSSLLRTWAKNLLMRWHRDDPVTTKEEDRNDGLYSAQGNRNPFIDFPALPDYIWGTKSSEPFYVDGNEPGDPGEQTEKVTYEWLGSADDTYGDWTFENVVLSEPLQYVWNWNTNYSNHWLNGSAYYGGAAYEAEAYAWSPMVDFHGIKKADLNFQHAAKYQTTLRELCRVAVKDVDTNEITLIDVPTWPASGNWNFANSGKIDLRDFAGKKVQVGFKYGSSTSGADTWEINDVVLEVEYTDPSGMKLPTEFDDSDLVELWGNVILAPQGARIFDLNGREFSAGSQLSRGIYIVVKPTFKSAVKVVVK